MDAALLADIDENAIIDKIIGGEERLYEVLIRKYNPYLYKTGRAYGFGHADTQDLMQESYISAYYHLSQFERRASFKTWLLRIMLNHCYQKHRRPAPIIESIPLSTSNEFLFNDSPKTEQVVMNKELGNVIEHALSKIPHDYRMVFSLRELCGLSTIETATTLKLSESNVKVRLNRAKSMLRKEIEKTYAPDDIYAFNLVYCDQVVNNVMTRIASKN